MKSKMIKLIFICIGLVMFIWFLLPFILKGMINLGNVSGILVSMLFVGYGLYFQIVNRFIINVWHKTYGKIVLTIMAAFLIMTIVLMTLFSFLMYQSAYHKPDKPTTVIVLGCRVYGIKPSLMLEERLNAAYDYLKVNPDVKCVVSGGKGHNEDISEAKCMYTYLVNKGIAKERIYLEDQSTSTRENILFSKKIIEENDLPEVVTIITNEFHQYRAKLIAKDLEMEVYAVSGRTAWWLFPTYYVRELFGIIYQFIF